MTDLCMTREHRHTELLEFALVSGRVDVTKPCMMEAAASASSCSTEYWPLQSLHVDISASQA